MSACCNQFQWFSGCLLGQTRARHVGGRTSMSGSRKLRIPLRVVFYREGESWIAHCLEFDLAGDGMTREDALAVLSDAIALQAQASLECQNPANLFTPADGELFHKYAAGADIVDGVLML